MCIYVICFTVSKIWFVDFYRKRKEHNSYGSIFYGKTDTKQQSDSIFNSVLTKYLDCIICLSWRVSIHTPGCGQKKQAATLAQAELKFIQIVS